MKVLYLFCCALFFLLPRQLYADGCELFIEACRYQGNNASLIWSGSAEIETTFALKPFTIKQVNADYIQRLEEQLKSEKDNRRANLIKVRLKQFQESLKKQSDSSDTEFRSICRVLFSGNEQFSGKRMQVTRHIRPHEGKANSDVHIVLGQGNPNNPASCTFVHWQSSTRSAEVSSRFVAVPEFHTFGRLNGSFLYDATDLLLAGSPQDKFVFPPKGHEAFREYLKSSHITISIVGEERYDDGNQASVIEVHKGGICVLRCLIDPSRGFVCPRLEEYDDAGRKYGEHISKDYFLHDVTGIWFPASFSRQIFNPNSGMSESNAIYVLRKDSLRINQKVSDQEFAVDVPSGACVSDRRHETDLQYIAVESGVLSLVSGGLNLEKLTWLLPTGITGTVVNNNDRGVWIRWFLMGSGLAMIVYAIWMRMRCH